MDNDRTRNEIKAISSTFGHKRDYMIERLRQMGIEIDYPLDGTFYVWADVSPLPDGLDHGMDFFDAAIDEQVICVPGEFFDVNPGQRRARRPSRFYNHVRFSFGPSKSSLERGLDRLEQMIERWQSSRRRFDWSTASPPPDADGVVPPRWPHQPPTLGGWHAD